MAVKTWVSATEEYLPCPFCGSSDLAAGAWCLDDEDDEVPAIECNNCYGAAPVRVWNERDAVAAAKAMVGGG